MNWIDYIILGILVFSTLMGMSRGLIKELLSLMFLITAVFIAMKYSDVLAGYFDQTSAVDNVNKGFGNINNINTDGSQPTSYIILCVSFLALFIGTILIGAVISFFINSFFHAGLIGVGNRLLGILFGFCRGIIVSVVMLFVLQFSAATNESAWEQSRLLPYFKPWVIKLNSIVSPKLDELKAKFQQGMNTFYGGQ